MPIDDPDVLLKDPEMSRDFLNHVLGTTPDTDPKPADAKHLEGEDVIIHGLKGRPELDEARVIKVRVRVRVRGNLGAACPRRRGTLPGFGSRPGPARAKTHRASALTAQAGAEWPAGPRAQVERGDAAHRRRPRRGRGQALRPCRERPAADRGRPSASELVRK